MKIQNRLGIFLGIGLFAMTYLLPPPAQLPILAWHVAGLALLMACWWIAEVVPIPVTAMLPIVIAPLFDLSNMQRVTSSYAHPVIFLFLGGFMIGLALEKWNLHRRLALKTVTLAGSKPSRQIAGFMLITAGLSMWVSNTATTIMMVPIALSVIDTMMKHETAKTTNFSKVLLLSIAYSASIGGIATLIGTPANALLVAFLETSYGIEISFSEWMLIALPISMLLLVFTWVYLSKFYLPIEKRINLEVEQRFKTEFAALGPITRQEILVAVIFVLTAIAWIVRPWISHHSDIALTDSGIAIIAAMSFFFVSADKQTGQKLLDWSVAKDIPWGILLLFGGGLCLADLMQASGLSHWIAHSLASHSHLSTYMILLLLLLAISFLTELTSNTATAASFLPPIGALAVSLDVNPLFLCLPATFATSCAFMMPVATPPNAIVFSFRKLQINDMLRAGFILNFFAMFVLYFSAFLFK